MPAPERRAPPGLRKYHNRLIKLCRILAAIGVDEKLFNKLAPGLAGIRDNQVIRYKVEDKIRSLLRQNGDFPL